MQFNKYYHFFAITLKADQLIIIPPYLEHDHYTPEYDNFSKFNTVLTIESFTTLKLYFSSLPKWADPSGFVFFRLVIAQALPFNKFMHRARPNVKDHKIGLWP